jgi:hypothetical protein
MKTTRLLLSSLVLSSAAVAANDDALRPIAFQNGVNQQALGAETAALAREILALIDELQRNGFPLQSLSALTDLAAQLQTLGGEEMTSIAARLRKLGENAQADPRATATEAYLAQQAIESRLKTLARQISIQQLREETARRLEALITRQLAIQRETKAIAAAKPDAERQRILESDQTGIGDDLNTFFQTGENLLSRLRETDTPAAGAAPAGPTFAERINGSHLTTLSTEAVAELKGKRYPSAYARQEALVVELRKILQGILSSLPKEQRLANALQQVSALRQQEEARQQSKTPDNPDSRQDAADQAQNLANQVAPLSPEAAEALRKAQQSLQDKPTPPGQQTAQQPANQPESPQQPGQDKSSPQKPDQAGDQTAQQNSPPNAQQPQPGQDPGQQQPQPGEQQPGQQTAQQPGQDQQPGQQKPGDQQQPGQQPSPAAQALAKAEAALQKALADAQAQAQAQNGQGQQPNGQQPGQQQANNGQPQQGQQTGQGQQQPGQPQTPQAGQGQQTAQTGQDGQPPGQNQPGGTPQSGPGDSQSQIAGHGPDSGGPAQVVGALRPQEREAFTALQGERYPAEYSAWVQQYWRNLAQEK